MFLAGQYRSTEKGYVQYLKVLFSQIKIYKYFSFCICFPFSHNSSTCKKNLIQVDQLQWHFHFLAICLSIHFIDTSSIRFCDTWSVIHFILTKTLQKKIRIEIWTFSCQIFFRNQFLTLGSGQTENYANMRCHIFSSSSMFNFLWCCVFRLFKHENRRNLVKIYT